MLFVATVHDGIFKDEYTMMLFAANAANRGDRPIRFRDWKPRGIVLCLEAPRFRCRLIVYFYLLPT
jgi:hypothetical protein